MGKGRKAIPDELKSLRGTNQPCRMTGGDAAMDKVSVIPKSGLKGTAKKVFEIVASELIHKNILEIVGLDLLVAYAREMALYHDTMRELEKEGFTVEVETKHGTTTMVNPKRKVAESALSNAKALAGEFGMTPATRNRVAALLTSPDPKDDFAEFEEIK